MMTIDMISKLLKILADRKARRLNRRLQDKGLREETLRKKLQKKKKNSNSENLRLR